MKYNLDVLNDKEFEDLCKDLLDAYYKVDFQLFKAGKDGGIDLLYGGPEGNEIVVQVKHYLGSGFAQLKQKLVKYELDNIKAMVPLPKRYVLATSLPLSPQQSAEIKDMLSPFVRSTDDIFGRSRLESILSKNPQIEEKFFKLWLTSTNVMRRILNNAVVNNSDFHREQILYKTKRYVVNDDFSHAVDRLKSNKFLIITGLPGVGKTTLAYMLICERLAAGCELIFSDGSISEVEGLLSPDPKKKQIFFIDDFLGANLHDIQNPKNPENKIISFVSKIQAFSNKYLVFTSRTTILNQANYRFESLRRSRLTSNSEYELELKSYSALNKARILYNHLYFNALDSRFTAPFYKKDVYTGIIKHDNFFPRLIEFITDVRHYDPDAHLSVEDFVFYQLDHPDEIWKHAFEQQLDDEDRFLVMTLFSLGGNYVAEDILEVAFTSRYEYEITNNGHKRKPLACRNSIKKLLNGFALASQHTGESQNRYSFLNPSITDFLLAFLKEDKTEQKAMLCSMAFIDQLFTYFGHSEGKIVIDQRMRPKIFASIVSNIDDIELVRPGNRAQSLLDVSMEFFPMEVVKDNSVALDLMKSILKDSSGINSFILSIIILQFDVEDYPLVNGFVRVNFYDYIGIILHNAKEMNDLSHITEIFDEFAVSFIDYINYGENKKLIESRLSTAFESFTKDVDFDHGEIITEIGERGRSWAEASVEDVMWNEYIAFVAMVKLDDYFDEFEHSYDVSVSDIIDSVLENIDYDDDEDRGYRGTITPDYDRPKDEWEDIDRLFS